MSAEQLSPGSGSGAAEVSAAENDALYSSDDFRMTAMKVLPCSKRFVHDWTECPYSHPAEKARRRDPRTHNYTGIACPSMKKEGCCAFQEHCPYAHNVFEYWLHPTRYRTQLCNDGSNCKRKICFFAHSLDELRVPACKPFVSPEALAAAAAAAANDAEAKRKAATIGSPLSAFTALSPGPSPQRTSFEALRASGLVSDRLSGSVAGPPSPLSAEGGMACSPADSAVQATLRQLAGAGFSTQEHQVIELVTSLLAQDKVSPEQAATILQQMLPAGSLNQLQAQLSTPRPSLEEGRYSDPLSQRLDSPSMPPASPGYEAASPGGAAQGPLGPSPAPQSITLEQYAAVQAARSLGGSYGGGVLAGQDPRMSMDSLRSSFDTARMSFENGGRGSMDLLGTPRSSLDATYPANLAPWLSASFPGQGEAGSPHASTAAALLRAQSAPRLARFYSGQLSSVPEQFPMINAPPPGAAYGANRFSLDSGVDRLSEDLSRMSFEASRAAPQPTANAYASSFFGCAPDHRGMGMPQLSPVRTSAPAKFMGMEEEEEAVTTAPASLAHQQMLGGAPLHRLH